MTKGHSEEYFSEDRDFWWNHDYLELMARRLRLNECSTLLDVGCGQCHWSRLLAPFLRKPAVVHALDTDPKWAAGSDEMMRHFRSENARMVAAIQAGQFSTGGAAVMYLVSGRKPAPPAAGEVTSAPSKTCEGWTT